MTEIEDKESVARAHLPYRAEYCKSNRAKCKKCQETMAGGSLKLANMVKSRFHDGYDANYYHVECFFRIKRPTSVAEISHFETLKYEDQKMLEQAIETNGHSVLMGEAATDIKSGGKRKSKGTKSASDQLVNYEDFLVEYAKSSRAKCALCEDNIMKETVRIGKLDYADTSYNGGPIPRWHHVECFVKSQEQLDFFGKIGKVKGFKELEKVDQKMLKSEVKQIDPPKKEEVMTKKIKAETGEKDNEERLLKKQSDRFFALREQVSKMKHADIEKLLAFMRQKSHYKASTILVDMATDILLFGPLRKCPLCKKSGGMLLRGSSYICTNELDSDGAQCTYETREPGRDAPDFPDEIIEKYPYFEDEYEFRPCKRIFPSKFLKAVEQKEAEDNHVAMDGAPLLGLSLGVITYASLKNDKLLVQKKATTLGAKINTALDKSLFVILTNKLELEKDTPKVEVAKALNVPFASDGFLFNIKGKEDVVKQLEKSLIGEWDGDLQERFEQMSKVVKSESQ